MMDVLLDPKLWCALVAIVAMEAVLGVDNLVYLALLTDGQPEAQRKLAERIGLGVAVASRLLLVLFVVLMLDLTQPVVTILDQPVSWRDIILVTGGIILLVKGTQEIYGIVEGPADKLDEAPSAETEGEANTKMCWVGISQMVLIDLAFATDSVASAFALSSNGWLVVFALLLGMGVLFLFAGPMSSLFTSHPSIRVIAFGMMLILGMVLLADGLGSSIPKGYIYFTLGLVALIEAIEIIFHRKG